MISPPAPPGVYPKRIQRRNRWSDWLNRKMLGRNGAKYQRIPTLRQSFHIVSSEGGKCHFLDDVGRRCGEVERLHLRRGSELPAPVPKKKRRRRRSACIRRKGFARLTSSRAAASGRARLPASTRRSGEGKNLFHHLYTKGKNNTAVLTRQRTFLPGWTFLRPRV